MKKVWIFKVFLTTFPKVWFLKFFLHPYSIRQNPMPIVFSDGFAVNMDFGTPTQILNLTIPFYARPRRFISCHFSALCQWDPVLLYTLVNAHNERNSKYTMKSATRMQVVEIWPIKCYNFCARKRRKATTCFQEEEYSEWVIGLHWIYIRSKGLYKSKVSAKVLAKRVCSEILQWVDWGCP
jgi:hypothetical protein